LEWQRSKKYSEKRKMQNDNVQRKDTDIKKRAYLFALRVIKLSDSVDQKDIAVQVIARQVLRSTTSIGANIIEAQAGSSRKDFTNFLSHALKSANETKFWLGLLKDSQKSNPEYVLPVLEESSQLANILGASLLTLRGKR
jgi:four helix bundle protein